MRAFMNILAIITMIFSFSLTTFADQNSDLSDYATESSIKENIPSHFGGYKGYLRSFAPEIYQQPSIKNKVADRLLMFGEMYPELDKIITEVFKRSHENTSYFTNPLYNFRFGVLFANMALYAAYEIAKCLSIYHANETKYGPILLGLFVAKAACWFIDSFLVKKDKKIAKEIIRTIKKKKSRNKSSGDTILNMVMDSKDMSLSEIAEDIVENIDGKSFDEEISAMSKINSKIDGAGTKITEIASEILENIDLESLNEDDKYSVERLSQLSDQLSGYRFFKNVFGTGGKTLSTISSIATGISIAASGQTSSMSYYLTLGSSAIDSFVDSSSIALDQRPVTQKSISVSEMFVICSKLIEKIKD